MTVIAVKELEHILDGNPSAFDDPVTAQNRRISIVTRAIRILIRCDYEEPMRDFILSCAMSTSKPPLGKFYNFGYV